jgi:hypothetical protein
MFFFCMTYKMVALGKAREGPRYSDHLRKIKVPDPDLAPDPELALDTELLPDPELAPTPDPTMIWLVMIGT